MKKFLFLTVFIGAFVAALNGQMLGSVNVPGDRLDGHNSMAIMYLGADSMAIAGTSDALSLHYFNFERGTTHRTLIKQQISAQVLAPIRGSAATKTLNDSAWILSGMLEQDEDRYAPFVMNYSRSGQVLWGVQINTPSHSIPQKVHALSDGGILLSMLTDAEESALGVVEGKWVLVKLSAQGALEWTFKPGLNFNETSYEAGIHELPSSELLCFYSKGSQTGLLKLSAQGGVLTHRLMEPGWTVKHSAINPQTQEVFLVGESQIWKTDSTLTPQQGVSLNNASLQGVFNVLYVNDSMLALGGVHQNQAVVFHYNPITQQIISVNQRALSVIASRSLGLFEVNQKLYSLTALGMALTQHQPNLDADCFNKLNPTLFSTQNLSLNPLGSGQNLSPQFTTTQLNNLVAQDSVEWQPSANCIDFDLSVRPPELNYENTCRNVVMPWFVFNHGTQIINSFKLTYYWNDSQVSHTFTGMSIAPKTGRVVEFGTPYLNPGLNNIGIRVSEPNGMQDVFPFNDSLFVTYRTGGNTVVSINFIDSLCSNREQDIVLGGPDNGTFALFRDDMLTLQSSQGRFTLSNGNAFFGRFTSEQGCVFYSDTIFPIELPAPPVPELFLDGDSLITNAPIPNIWFLFSNPIAENQTSIPIKETGLYAVQTIAENGCTEISEPFAASPASTNMASMQNKVFVYNNVLENLSSQKLEYTAYSLNGQRIAQGKLNAKHKQELNLAPGVYLLRYVADSQHYSLKFVVY